MKALLFILFTLFATSCSTTKWYKGNTHVHTILCGHADSSPEAVTKWYHDHGYNFLILSEHNIFIDPAKVKMPIPLRNDFILIPGQEVTGIRDVHTTAMNTKGLVPWGDLPKPRSKVIQNQVDRIEKQGGVTILNHPNYKNALTPKDMLPVERLYMFEVFNNSWWESDFSEYHEDHPSEEVWWDRLLSAGMVMYGVGSDDAHDFKEYDFKKSNPGRGWVMVQADKLDSESITRAMFHGDFYTSTGVYLKEYTVLRDKIIVSANAKETIAELAKPIVRKGKPAPSQKFGFKIELIGNKGKLLESVNSTWAEFDLKKLPRSPYYRVKISYVQDHPERGKEAYFAWCQPIFKDGREKKIQVIQHDYLHKH